MPRPSSTSGDVVHLVDEILARAAGRRASDVHFEPTEAGMRVRYRLDGMLHDVDSLPGAMSENVVARLKVLAGLLTYHTGVPQEGAYVMELPDQDARLDVRVATFPTIHGERAVVRLMHPVGQVSDLGELGLSADAVEKLRHGVERPSGLVLVTGPAGAGKSTTLYALARHVLSVTPGRSVVSLEDPVEQRVPGLTQIQIQPHGELNYVRAMRSLLRQDVQVLLVGEIRDAETAHIVIEAALTGHLIMSTMHSGDPAETLARLLEMGIAPYQVVSALTLICSQRLLRTTCAECRGSGCPACEGTGLRGRTACGQLANVEQRLRNEILAHSPTARLREVIREQGPDLAADASRLVRESRTTREEVLRVLGITEASSNEART